MKNYESMPSNSWFSFRRNIKCGLGISGACCVDGLRVCKDVPVFRGEALKKMEFGIYWRNECGERVVL